MRGLTASRQAWAGVPPPTPWLLRLFQQYVRSYLRRHFHALRLACPAPPTPLPEGPLIVYLNHPAWWDPLISFFLAYTLFPEREHYAPIEAQALARYRFFARLGFFGIATGTRQGAVTFLRVSESVLRRPAAVLWITPGGAFTDPRTRPVVLRPGLGHLLKRVRDCRLLPLALEYPFWQERLPEALACFGALSEVETGAAYAAEAWTRLLAQRLEATQDVLGRAACSRDRGAFKVLLHGRVGIGGVYDLWRAGRACWRGERFQRAHGRAE